jgi:hypothetical protein
VIDDLTKFRESRWQRRTASVKLPALSGLYDDPVVKVQNLTGSEVYDAESRVLRNSSVADLIIKIASQVKRDKVDGILETLGFNDNVPDALVKAIAYVEFGTVTPKFEQSDAVKLADVSFESFMLLFRKIDQLTGAGSVMLGESNASGTTNGSATP